MLGNVSLARQLTLSSKYLATSSEISISCLLVGTENNVLFFIYISPVLLLCCVLLQSFQCFWSVACFLLVGMQYDTVVSGFPPFSPLLPFGCVSPPVCLMLLFCLASYVCSCSLLSPIVSLLLICFMTSSSLFLFIISFTLSITPVLFCPSVPETFLCLCNTRISMLLS